MWFHGGGFLINTRKTRPDLREYFADDGYAMATVSYRLAPPPEEGVNVPFSVSSDNPTPRATYPAQICDAKAAIRWLRTNAGEYGYDPESIAVWGASAGAHVAALTAVVDDVADVQTSTRTKTSTRRYTQTCPAACRPPLRGTRRRTSC